MKTKLLVLFISFSCLSFSQITSIPDSNFEQALIDLGIDRDGLVNGQMLTLDALSIPGEPILDVSNKNISDLTGIEAFTNLPSLICNGNQITSLDLSNNPDLIELNCSNNQLTSLNIKNGNSNNLLPFLFYANNNPNLSCIQVDDPDFATTNFTNIDQGTVFSTNCVSSNLTTAIPDTNFEQALIDLGIDSDGTLNGAVFTSDISGVTNLDVSDKNISDLTGIEDFSALVSLDCSFNQLYVLDISLNIILTSLNCSNNTLINLNVKNSNNNAITPSNFDARNNPNLICIEVDDISYANLNWNNKDNSASYNTNCNSNNQPIYIPDSNFEQALIDLNIDSDGVINKQILNSDALGQTAFLVLENKNISDLTGIEAFVNITELHLDNNQITSLDLSNNTNLWRLVCHNNNISSINVNNNSKLIELWANNCELTHLDVSNNPLLKRLSFSENKLTTINISNNPDLDILQCPDNLLTSIDVSNNPLLTSISISNNKLASLNVSNNTALTSLQCSNNNLSSLDVSNNTLLTYLSCWSNDLNILDISNNTLLESLQCHSNQLTNINISNNTVLDYFSCSSNQLTSLDVSNNPLLETLNCGYNQLTDLNISKNLNLINLHILNNAISSLDLSLHNLLEELRCQSNNLTYLNLKNGNNIAFKGGYYFNVTNNPNLTCIEVDDVSYSTTNWTSIDAQTSFSTDCGIAWFSNSDDYASFTATDSDNDSFTWKTQNGNVSAKKLVSGTSFFSESYDAIHGALTPDNLLITPAGEITIPANVSSISFKLNVEASNASRPAENFAIYVFDEAIGQSFDNKIYEETLTIGGIGTAKDINVSIPNSFAGKTIGIIVRHYNCTGQDKLYVDDFEVSYEAPSLSTKNNQKEVFKLYPNPTKDKITVNINKMTSYSLINTNGQVLQKGNLTKRNNKIDVSQFSNGLYFLSLTTKQGSVSKKIIKQ